MTALTITQPSSKALHKTQITNAFNLARKTILAALQKTDEARQKCLLAGQILCELKAICEHGEFMGMVEQIIPEVSHATVNMWMRAAANVVKALPAIDIEIEKLSLGEILSRPDEDLPESAKNHRQLWLNFISDKTIRECMDGVFVGGDDSHRIDRAINGKTKGGAGGDRKDFPLFVAVKLKDMGTHLSHWKKMNEVQKSEVITTAKAAILGDTHRLRNRNFNFQMWPDELCEAVAEALRERRAKRS